MNSLAISIMSQDSADSIYLHPSLLQGVNLCNKREGGGKTNTIF